MKDRPHLNVPILNLGDRSNTDTPLAGSKPRRSHNDLHCLSLPNAQVFLCDNVEGSLSPQVRVSASEKLGGTDN